LQGKDERMNSGKRRIRRKRTRRTREEEDEEDEDKKNEDENKEEEEEEEDDEDEEQGEDVGASHRSISLCNDQVFFALTEQHHSVSHHRQGLRSVVK
jgi:hypothetical protein